MIFFLTSIFFVVYGQQPVTISYQKRMSCQTSQDQTSINCGDWESISGSFRFSKGMIYHSSGSKFKFDINDVEIVDFHSIKWKTKSVKDNQEYRFLVDINENIISLVLPYYENKEHINYIKYYKFNPKEVIYE